MAMKWNHKSGSGKGRRKGIVAERELVRRLDLGGIAASRVPLSGQLTAYPGDLLIPIWFGDCPCEVKRRENLPEKLWLWLADNAALFIRRTRRPWLIVMKLDAFIELHQRSVAQFEASGTTVEPESEFDAALEQHLIAR